MCWSFLLNVSIECGLSVRFCFLCNRVLSKVYFIFRNFLYEHQGDWTTLWCQVMHCLTAGRLQGVKIAVPLKACIPHFPLFEFGVVSLEDAGCSLRYSVTHLTCCPSKPFRGQWITSYFVPILQWCSGDTPSCATVILSNLSCTIAIWACVSSSNVYNCSADAVKLFLHCTILLY